MQNVPEQPLVIAVFGKNGPQDPEHSALFQKRKQQVCVTEYCMDLCGREEVFTVFDPRIIPFDCLEGICTGIIMDQATGRRQKNAVPFIL